MNCQGSTVVYWCSRLPHSSVVWGWISVQAFSGFLPHTENIHIWFIDDFMLSIVALLMAANQSRFEMRTSAVENGWMDG